MVSVSPYLPFRAVNGHSVFRLLSDRRIEGVWLLKGGRVGAVFHFSEGQNLPAVSSF